MELDLSPEVRRFVEERVKSGEYGSVREVVEAGIARLMFDPDPEIDEDTLAALDEGMAQLERGDTIPWHELRAELLAKHPPK